MKKIMFRLAFATLAAIVLGTGCAKEGENVPPGLWIEQPTLRTFPTDEAAVKGTASNYVGISTIVLNCESWSLSKTYDLSSQKPEVFNFDYRFTVPADATFSNDVMTVTVTDVNGLQTEKTVNFEFLPDSESPTSEPVLPSSVSVEFDAAAEASGIWAFDINLYDRRGLGTAVISVPSASVSETVQLGGAQTYRLTREYTLAAGTHEATVTVSDLAGNTLPMVTSVVVMAQEDEDPISNYSQMFLVNAAEDPADYLDGYYVHMDPAYADGVAVPYAYQGTFYAPAEGMGLYIVPTESMDADVFGVSPYVDTKLMNKRGYVKPIPVPGAGYYGIYIDIQNHSYSFWSIDPSSSATACSEDIWISGTGFASFADWSSPAEAMTRDGNRYTCTCSVNAGTVAYYFYTAGWARVFRADTAGYWWYESGSGGCAEFASDYSGEAVGKNALV